MLAALALALLAVEPAAKLGADERAHFKKQLEVVLGRVLAQLSAKQVQCAVSSERPEWVDAETTTDSHGSLAPRQWYAIVGCKLDGKQPFRMAVNLSATPFPAPKKDIVARGEGFVIRWVGPEAQTLVVGPYFEFGPTDPFPIEVPNDDPPPLARPVAVLVVAESGPGKPDPLGVLKRIDVAATAAVRDEVARFPPPKTALQAVDLTPVRGHPLPQPVLYAAAAEPEPASLESASALRRVLAPDERAYFTTVLARAVPAVIEALGGRKRCSYGRSVEAPEDEAEASPDGYRARSWEFHVECDSADGGSTAVYVELRRRRAAGRATDVKLLAPDAVLRTEDTDVLPWVLSVGDPSVEEGSHRRPGLTRLGNLELTCAERGALERINVAPLRALLKAAPSPPAWPAAAVEGEATKLPRAELENAVYRAVLDDLAHGRQLERMVVEAELTAFEHPPLEAPSLLSPEVLPSAVADFKQVERKRGPLPASLTWRAPLVRVGRGERNALFAGRDGWQQFRKRYPGAAGIVSLSRVGLSRDGTQAVVYRGSQSDWLAGHGELSFLRCAAGRWSVIYRLPLWIS